MITRCERYTYISSMMELLLVNLDGEGPCLPVQGRRGFSAEEMLRLPTPEEARNMGIEWSQEDGAFHSAIGE